MATRRNYDILLQAITGLADSKWSGPGGSVAAMVGLDIHSTPGLTKVHQKLTKESGTTVTEFCKIAVASSNGYSFWFSSTSGKIWARSSMGVWTLAYTTVPSSGTAGCTGAKEYHGYIYWATQNYIHRIQISNADDDWAAVDPPYLVPNWHLFPVTDLSFHPMEVQGGDLFVADGHQLHRIDDTDTFLTPAVLDFGTPYRIKCMASYDIDLLIGTYIADTVNSTYIFRWDTVSPQPISRDRIEEVGINAFIRDDNYIYANCGRAGNMYYYDGAQLKTFIKVPGTYSSTQWGTVNPGSVANFRGIPVFGFSNGAGNPAKEGVYSFGSYSANYKKSLDLSWLNSQNKSSDQQIGAILALDFDLLVAWNDNSSAYGVDKIDYTAKYTAAYFETLMLDQMWRNTPRTLAGLRLLYNTLPASTSFSIYYSLNGADYVLFDAIVPNSLINAIDVKNSIPDMGSMQIKVVFNVSGNTSPDMEMLARLEE